MRGLCVRRLSNLRPPSPPPARQALHLTFERLGCSAWLDMDAENLTLGGMRRGVEDSVNPERSAPHFAK